MSPSSFEPTLRRSLSRAMVAGTPSRAIRGLALAALLATQGAALAADPDLLWEGERSGTCHLSVRFDQGRLEVDAGRGRPHLDGSATHWTTMSKATSAEGVTVLDLVATRPDATMRLSLPERCTAQFVAESGAITLNTVPASGVRAESVTGDIVLYVPRKADLAVDAATSGNLSVDFDLDLDYLHHQEPSKRGHLRIGSGSAPVSLESKRGAVRVLSEKRRTAHTGSARAR